MSDIRIGYVLSPTWDSEPPSLDAADETTLRYRCFFGDVILSFGELDASAGWGWVPILDFALALRTISDRLLGASHLEVFEFTESDASITFQRTNDDVVIDPSYAPGVAHVPLPELVRSSRGFLTSLLSDLVDRYPQLAGNEFVATLSKPDASADDS